MTEYTLSSSCNWENRKTSSNCSASVQHPISVQNPLLLRCAKYARTALNRTLILLLAPVYFLWSPAAAALSSPAVGPACEPAKAGMHNQLPAWAHPRVAMTWLVDDQYSMALLMPEPALMGMPALIMAISAPTR